MEETMTWKVREGGRGRVKKSCCWMRAWRERRSMAVASREGQSRRVVVMAPTSNRRSFLRGEGGREDEVEEEEGGVRVRRPMACRRARTHLLVLWKETESWEADW